MNKTRLLPFLGIICFFFHIFFAVSVFSSSKNTIFQNNKIEFLLLNNEQKSGDDSNLDKTQLNELISDRLFQTQNQVAENILANYANSNEFLNAEAIWSMSSAQCLNYLNENNIAFEKPSFETPYVRTPLILTGPINGIEISPRNKGDIKRKVMDCSLVVALTRMSSILSNMGVSKVEYFAVWRPLASIPKHCFKKNTNQCKRIQKRHQKAQNGILPSQHNRATAIDIGWFTFEDETVIDIEQDYERQLKAPPCSLSTTTSKGQFLKDLVCQLHEERLFNVILTPNTDNAHKNHFHFDITPFVSWYIIR